MRAVTKRLIGTKSTAAQIGLLTFLRDTASLVFDNTGARNLERAVFEWSDDYGIAHGIRVAAVR